MAFSTILVWVQQGTESTIVGSNKTLNEGTTEREVIRVSQINNTCWVTQKLATLLLHLRLKGQKETWVNPSTREWMGHWGKGATVMERSPFCQRHGPKARKEQGRNSLAFFLPNPLTSCSTSYWPWTQLGVSQYDNPRNASHGGAS